MATAVDPVRRTLDTLALDPAAAQDRPYLESMLRRLGYSEAEIQAALGRGTAPAAEPAASATAEPDEGERRIEVEYTGPGLRTFNLAIGVDASELANDPLGLGAGLEAGTEVFEGGPSMEEVDRLVAEGDLSDFDDWGDGAKEGEGAPAEGTTPEGEAPALDLESLKTDAPVGGEEIAPAGDGGADFAGTAPAEGSGTLELPPGEQGTAPAATGPDYQSGEPMVEFQAMELNEAVVQPVDAAREAERLQGLGWDVADPATGEFAQEEAPEAPADDRTWEQAGDEPFQYGDWTLFKRDELRGDQPQRVYFFSRGTPEGGEPAPIPEGYEVAENPETGRPFLRRSAEGGEGYATDVDLAHPSADPTDRGQPKKRVRILRVRAASREEAMQKLAAEGRNVIASMPIDIEKKLR